MSLQLERRLSQTLEPHFEDAIDLNAFFTAKCDVVEPNSGILELQNAFLRGPRSEHLLVDWTGLPFENFIYLQEPCLTEAYEFADRLMKVAVFEDCQDNVI